MSDGPFKNLKLDARSKRFAEAVANDSFDDDMRCALASDAIVNSILQENSELLRSLRSYAQELQLEFNPHARVDAIFGAHRTSQFADHLHRQIGFVISEGVDPHAAIRRGLEEAVVACVGEFRTRMQEAWLEARETGGLRHNEVNDHFERIDLAVAQLNRQRIAEALWNVAKDAFQQDVKKKDGLDEGPEL